MNHIGELKKEILEVQATKVNPKAEFDQIKVDIASLITNVKAAELEIIEVRLCLLIMPFLLSQRMLTKHCKKFYAILVLFEFNFILCYACE